VHRVGHDARLGAGEADRVVPHVDEGHREQRHRDALAGREQNVELTGMWNLGHLVSQLEQLVGRLAHRRDHHDGTVARGCRRGNPLGNRLDPLGSGD
jgi:hypothetical protein